MRGEKSRSYLNAVVTIDTRTYFIHVTLTIILINNTTARLMTFVAHCVLDNGLISVARERVRIDLLSVCIL